MNDYLPDAWTIAIDTPDGRLRRVSAFNVNTGEVREVYVRPPGVHPATGRDYTSLTGALRAIGRSIDDDQED